MTKRRFLRVVYPEPACPEPVEGVEGLRMTLIETFPVSRFGRFLQHLLSHQGQDSKDGSVDGSFFSLRSLVYLPARHLQYQVL